MRDRLRAVECPKEIIDQIGGWSSSDIGESYGEGFTLKILSNWFQLLLLLEIDVRYRKDYFYLE